MSIEEQLLLQMRLVAEKLYQIKLFSVSIKNPEELSKAMKKFVDSPS